MPTPRKGWPDVLGSQEKELLEILESLHRVFLVSSEYKLSLANYVFPQLDHVYQILLEINNIKQVEYETGRIIQGKRGDWPRWLVNGIEPAKAIICQIKNIITEIEKTHEAIIKNVRARDYKTCADLVEKLLNWVKEKKDL